MPSGFTGTIGALPMVSSPGARSDAVALQSRVSSGACRDWSHLEQDHSVSGHFEREAVIELAQIFM